MRLFFTSAALWDNYISHVFSESALKEYCKLILQASRIRGIVPAVRGSKPPAVSNSCCVELLRVKIAYKFVGRLADALVYIYWTPLNANGQF